VEQVGRAAPQDISQARAKTLRARSCPIPQPGRLAGWQPVTDAVLLPSPSTAVPGRLRYCDAWATATSLPAVPTLRPAGDGMAERGSGIQGIRTTPRSATSCFWGRGTAWWEGICGWPAGCNAGSRWALGDREIKVWLRREQASKPDETQPPPPHHGLPVVTVRSPGHQQRSLLSSPVAPGKLPTPRYDVHIPTWRESQVTTVSHVGPKGYYHLGHSGSRG